MFAHDEARLRDDTLDGREYDLIVERYVEFFQFAIEESGRYGEDYVVSIRNRFVDIGSELEFGNVEFHRTEVIRIVVILLQMFDSLVVTHIPCDFRKVLAKHLGDCRCPATASDDRKLRGSFHEKYLPPKLTISDDTVLFRGDGFR